MFRTGTRWTLAIWIISLVLCTALPALAAAPIDATLFTTYDINSTAQTVNWLDCGSTQQTSGCYGSGSLGPFGRVGALMEGNSSTNLKTNTVTRAIYVVDVGSNTNGVVLYVYKKTDTVSSSSDTVSVTLSETVTLPLTGGSTALCSMAANKGFLFIGTNKSPQAVRVQKRNLTVTVLPGFNPPINVTAITADQYGYVTVTQGGFNSSDNGYFLFGPDGNISGDGGGAPFMLNTVTAVVPSTLPKSDQRHTPRQVYSPQ